MNLSRAALPAGVLAHWLADARYKVNHGLSGLSLFVIASVAKQSRAV